MKIGIRRRLVLATTLPAILAILLLLLGFLSRHQADLTEALRDRGIATARQLGMASEFPLFANNDDGLSQLTQMAKAGDPQVIGAAVYGRDGRLLSLSGKLTTPLPAFNQGLQVLLGETVPIITPIHATLQVNDLLIEGEGGDAPAAGPPLLGYALVELSLDKIHSQQHALLIWSLITTFIGLLLATLLSALVAASVTRPIMDIGAVVQRIGDGDLAARADTTHAGPLRRLARGINAMAAQVALTQENLQQQVEQATRELRRQKEAAELAARIDPLTGVLSRRAFTDVAENEILRAWRYGSPLSLIMVDLDHFKAVNDNHGHAGGDAVLRGFADTLRAVVREVDVIGRIGGEEFVVLLPDTGVIEAMQAAERMRQAIAESKVAFDYAQLSYSASFGVAEFDQKEVSLSYLLSKADTALYQAKKGGRNRVEVAVADHPVDSVCAPTGQPANQ